MNCVHDTKALELSREVMALMYGPIPTGGSVQLQAKIQCLFADAMDFAAGNSPAIPDGYVLVPVEPTVEMLDEFDLIIDYGAEDSKDAWSRLIAAAPQQEAE
ncbi:TPA: hypothetical protein ACPEY2_001672 [Citrobacter amalonaticus]